MKALLGAWEDRPYRLLAEVTALRTKVRALEHELARLQEENAALRAQALRVDVDELEVALPTG